jgi:hypothetical protein
MDSAMTAVRWFCQAIAASVAMAGLLTMIFGLGLWNYRVGW